MTQIENSGAETARRGQAWYEEHLREKLEAGNRGKFLVLNVETGEYEIDADDLAASKRAKARFGDAPLFTVRVGYSAAYRLGGHSSIQNP
jgi:hypothetical protein